jgi:MFS family permease
MAVFSAAAVGGLALGPLPAGWVEMNPKLKWRWIQWIQMMCATLCLGLHVLIYCS